MKKSILLIDDEPNIRKMMSLILSPLGYAVSEAQNGSEALQILEKSNFSLIVSDQNMPVLDGLAFLSALRFELKSDIPVLMMSGDTNDDLRRQCYALGVYDFISKPESADILLARVENGLKIAMLQQFQKDTKQDLRVSAGDWLLAYTDGVLDIFDQNQYKEDSRLQEIAQAGKDAAETYALVMEHISAQRGISDDRTIMLFAAE